MTNKFLKYHILLIAAFTGCFFITACENDYNEVKALGKSRTPVDTIINVESYLSQGGIVKAILRAPIMATIEADTQRTEFPKTLKVDFYNDSAKIESRLFAKYGLYYADKRLVYLKDSVVVFNMLGDTLRSDELWWDQNKEIFYTDAPVQIRKPDEKIDGSGLTADQNFSYWTIRNARGPINVADSTIPGGF